MITYLLVVLIVLGVVFYYIENYITLSPPFKFAVRLVGVIIVFVILLRVLQLLLPGFKLP
jgi:hypothetical protein